MTLLRDNIPAVIDRRYITILRMQPRTHSNPVSWAHTARFCTAAGNWNNIRTSPPV